MAFRPFFQIASCLMLLVILVLLLDGVHSFGLNSAGGVSRRDALFTAATTGGGSLLSIVAAATSQPAMAGAAEDLLSLYKDGPRGIKYLITTEGNGSGLKPTRGQNVKASYALYINGFKEDGGKEIDSSKGGLLGKNKPFEFNVGVSQVIKGWDLILLDMEQGEARRLVVPSDLGYGEEGFGGQIPGGATLYFDVQLNEIGKMPEMNEKQIQWLVEHPL